MSNKLEVKDLINIGIFTIIYFVSFSAVAMTGYIPFFMIILPLIGPIVAGIPFMLFISKVKKFGMVTIMGIIIGLIMVAMGHLYVVVILGAACGLVGDLILKSGQYKSIKLSIFGYAVFSEWILGALIAFFFGFRQNYLESLRDGFGDVYVEKIAVLTPDWLFFVMIVLAFVGGILGGFLGRKVLKKHFIKAGIV